VAYLVVFLETRKVEKAVVKRIGAARSIFEARMGLLEVLHGERGFAVVQGGIVTV
jgi:hypothetical protein